MGSVKHPYLEKNAEKLEKTQKSSVHILRTEQKPWTGFKGGEKLATCCLQPQGKSSVREGRGELLLRKCREQCPQLLSAGLQETASLKKSCLPQPQLCGFGSGSLGSALAWLVSVAALWLKALCQGCSERSCSPQQSREQGRWGMWGAGRAQRQEVCLERHPCSYCGEKSGIQRAPGCVHELVGRVW